MPSPLSPDNAHLNNQATNSSGIASIFTFSSIRNSDSSRNVSTASNSSIHMPTSALDPHLQQTFVPSSPQAQLSSKRPSLTSNLIDDRIDLFQETLISLRSEYDRILQEDLARFTTKHKDRFQLLRIQEDCRKMHFENLSKEIEMGKKLAKNISNELMSPDYENLDYINQMAGDYISTYRTNIDKVSLFPWQTFEKDMIKSATTLCKYDNSKECRSYVKGYFEVIGRISYASLSPQGVATFEAASVALRRHPFASCISSFRLAFAYLVDQLQGEIIPHSRVKLVLNKFVSVFTDAWCHCWHECSNEYHEIVEIFIEAIQHVIFVHCQYIPYLLSSNYTTYQRIRDKVDYFELPSYLQLSSMYEKCSIPSKYCMYIANSDVTSIAQTNIDTICMFSFSQCPFQKVLNEIELLNFVITPPEIIAVLVQIVSKVSETCSHIQGIYDVENFVKLSADELVPLLGLCFSLYVRTPVIENIDSQQNYHYRDPLKFILLVKFAELYIPPYLMLGEEGYLITLCLTALLTVSTIK